MLSADTAGARRREGGGSILMPSSRVQRTALPSLQIRPEE